jgi:VWFA-related protein
MIRAATFLQSLLVLFCILPQQISHEVRVVNIAVPVRVYSGGHFVDSLKLGDFEVFEDGKPQTVQSVYYIQKNEVKRGETPPRTAAPPTARHFVLLFEMSEFLPEIDTAIDYFFDNVFAGGDTLDVVTARTTHRLREDISSKALREKTKSEIKSKIRTDSQIQGGEVKTLVREMTLNLEEDNLDAYEANLHRLEAMRAVDEKRMLAFAESLRSRPGAKHVFLFLQREMIPAFTPRILTERLSDAGSDVQFKLISLMTHFYRDMIVDRTAIARAFSDASIDVHFLFVTKEAGNPGIDATNFNAIQMSKLEEHSEDIFKAFSEIAAATGGISYSSANIAGLMKTAAEASDSYYLLYYQPKEYVEDGKFHSLTVKIKAGDFQVTHRAGYIARDVPALPAPAPDVEIPASRPPAAKTKESPRLDPARAAELASVLEKAAAYCRRLENAALNFVCAEEVVESIYGGGIDNFSDLMATLTEPRVIQSPPKMNWPINTSEWIYDYQLIRGESGTQEKRTLLKENGDKKHEENAGLKTKRFSHARVVLGPIGLLGERAQASHTYGLVKESRMDGDPIWVIEVTPAASSAASLFGRAWVRKKDGAVLRIEWEPSSMENYAEIAEIGRRFKCVPQILFTSEYGFEKNGLRFPNSYAVVESYKGLRTAWGAAISRTAVKYKDYKFFQVETAVDIR